jgi:hypothetical protein
MVIAGRRLGDEDQVPFGLPGYTHFSGSDPNEQT